MKRLLFLGIALRLFLIPIHPHADIRAISFGAQLISQKGQILHFYDHLNSLPASHQLIKVFGKDLFIYPPLAFITPAVFMKVLSPLYPWPLFDQYVYNTSQLTGHPQFPLILYLIKVPYLLIDLVGLWILLKITNSKFAAAVWLFNPVSLYVTYLIGQFDVYITVLSLLAVYKGSSMTLGLAAGFKPFPLFYLPFLSGNKIKNITTGLLAYCLIISPYLFSSGFRKFALLAPQTGKLFSSPIFLAGFVAIQSSHFLAPSKLPVWGWLGAVTLLFYSTIHFHPQWIMWGLPFFILSFILNSRSRIPLICLSILYFLYVLTFDPSLNTDILHLNPVSLPKYYLPSVKIIWLAISIYLIYIWLKHPRGEVAPAVHLGGERT